MNLINETKVTNIEITHFRQKVRINPIRIKNTDHRFGAFTLSMDRQPKDCIEWRVSEQQIWVIKLNRKANVQYIRFKFYAENLQKFWSNKEFVLNISQSYQRQ